LPKAAPAGAVGTRSAVLEAHGRDTVLTLEVATRPLRLSAGEQLAAVLWHRDSTPWTTPNPYSEPMVIPIGLTESRHLAAFTRYQIDLRDVPAAEVRSFVRVSLYVLSGELPKQLSSRNVVQA